MAVNAKIKEFINDYQRQSDRYFDTQPKSDRIEGGEAKRLIEARLEEKHDLIEKLGVVIPNHPLCTTLEDCLEYTAIQYYDGTLSAQVKEKSGNTKQLIFWGNKGPVGIVSQVYYMDTARTGAEQIAVLTESNQIIGTSLRFNKQVGTYQIDLE